MRSALAVIATACLILLTIFSESLAQRSSNTVHGMVKVPSNVGLKDLVRVRLERLGATVHEVLLRDSTFSLSNVEDGHYTLIADAPGLEPVRQEIDVPGDWPVIEFRARRNDERRPEAV